MAEDLPTLVATNVRALVEKKGLTQEQLKQRGAKSAGTAHRAMSLNDKGKGQNARLITIANVAKALDVPAWQLLIPGLDPDHLPRLVTEADYQQEVRRRLKKAITDAAEREGEQRNEGEVRRSDGSAGSLRADRPAATGKSEPSTRKTK